jgi:hypothetical protein
MHPKSLGQGTDNLADIHIVEEGLLLPDHTFKVFSGEIQQVLELFDPGLRNLSRGIRNARLFKESGGFLMVLPRYVEGVFQRGFMFESRFLFHDTILCRFPGGCQSTRRET